VLDSLELLIVGHQSKREKKKMSILKLYARLTKVKTENTDESVIEISHFEIRFHLYSLLKYRFGS